MDALLNWIPEYGYPALFLLLMLGIVGLPIPDETLLTFSGYLIFKSELALMPTMVTAFLGSICGITISYAIGRRLGMYFVRTVGRILRIKPDDLDKGKAWYVRWGKYALIVGYFVPGVRHLVALVAGSSNLPLVIFIYGSTHMVGDVSRVGLWFRGNMGACVCHTSPRSRARWWYCIHNGCHRILPPSDEKTSMTAMLDCPAPLWISALDLLHNWIPLDKGQSDARGRAHRTVLGGESRGAVTRIHYDTTLGGIWKIAF
jgi:membrane protein DedA with SNARE-associated domain